MKRNYFLAIALLVFAIACIATGIILDFHLIGGKGSSLGQLVKNGHIYAGYIMMAGITVHFLLHISWLQNMTQRIYNGEYKKIASKK